MQLLLSRIFLILLVTFATRNVPTFAKKKNKSVAPPADTTVHKTKPHTSNDSAKKDPIKKLITFYKELIKDSTTSVQKGLFTVYLNKEKYYIEIPDSLLEKDILVVNRLSKAGSGMRGKASFWGYAGDLISNPVIQFTKTPNRQIYVREMSYSETGGNPKDEMYQSVQNSNIAPIIANFPFVGISPDSTKILIELSAYLNTDNPLFGFHESIKKNIKIGSYQSNKSYVIGVRSFPINLQIQTFKTYSVADLKDNKRNYSMEINTSLILLPKQPMIPRWYDARVGYFVRQITDFQIQEQGVKNIKMITRWRLEPKQEDIEKYKKGTLVEPKKPIVFYIDPATPERWIPYMIKGINWWQKAFETAGFKNAIIGKRAPTKEEDSTWSLEDARYSAFVYKASTVPNASGPHIHDPRSGEILESHINWYHNIMKLVRNWYMIQCGQSDSTARHLKFPDTLMGKLISYVAAHEVGHTLGLRHNWGSSHAIPVEKFRDKKWILENGFHPSIMDYARFNYIAQPEDSMPQNANLPTGVGIYDKWAIEWGYKHWLPEVKNPSEEQDTLNQVLIAKSKDPRYWFGREDHPTDPRTQREDLGDNAIIASRYGIKNLQYIFPRLIQWTAQPNENYDELRNQYNELVNQYFMYLYHVMKIIGGIYETPQSREQGSIVFEPVPKILQKNAVQFLNEQVFIPPVWLNNIEIISKIGINYTNLIVNLQNTILTTILSPSKIKTLYDTEKQYGNKFYTPYEFLTTLKQLIFKEIMQKPENINIHRRSLQRIFIEKMLFLSGLQENTSLVVNKIKTPPPYISTDIEALSQGILKEIQVTITSKLRTFPYAKNSKYHLEHLANKIEKAFKKGN